MREAVGPPATCLAIRIVELAIHDWKKPSRQAEKQAQEMGFSSLREELRIFFRSDRCQKFLDLLDCDLDLLELLRQAERNSEP